MNDWVRPCSRCNGPIYKGEGRVGGKRSCCGTLYYFHKSIELCKQRQDIRIKEEREKLLKTSSNGSEAEK